MSLLRGRFGWAGGVGALVDAAGLLDLFRAFRHELEAVSRTALLDGVLKTAPACRALLDLDTRIDHFGFLLPPGAEDAFRDAATRAGFGRATPAFRSTHLARELGTLTGRREVRTDVAKQTGVLAGHGPVALEAFFPEVDSPVAHAWMADGVGSHLAVEVADPRAFQRIVSEFPRHGLRTPAFMGGPQRVPAEHATIAYFEFDPPSVFPRIEVRIRDGRPR